MAAPGFKDRCLKPLGHPSVFGVQRLSRGVGPGKASIATGSAQQATGLIAQTGSLQHREDTTVVGRRPTGLVERQRE
jgi:hypothetical protein